MIKNIIFDLGGVLVDFNPQRCMNNHFPTEIHEVISKCVFRSYEWKQLDKGTVSLDEAYKKMCSEIPKEYHTELYKILTEHEAEMPPIEPMYDVVKRLHSNGYKLYLLSNCPEWFSSYKNSVPALSFFDGFIISAEHKQLKPDYEIYHTLLNKYSLNAEDCLFIDDSPANTMAAEQLGFKTHCFADRDICKLIDTFAKLKIKY